MNDTRPPDPGPAQPPARPRPRRCRTRFGVRTFMAIWNATDGRCHLCGGPVTIHDATIDHVCPKAQGGPNDRENLRLAHEWCNNAKGDQVEPQHEELRAA